MIFLAADTAWVGPDRMFLPMNLISIFIPLMFGCIFVLGINKLVCAKRRLGTTFCVGSVVAMWMNLHHPFSPMLGSGARIGYYATIVGIVIGCIIGASGLIWLLRKPYARLRLYVEDARNKKKLLASQAEQDRLDRANPMSDTLLRCLHDRVLLEGSTLPEAETTRKELDERIARIRALPALNEKAREERLAEQARAERDLQVHREQVLTLSRVIDAKQTVADADELLVRYEAIAEHPLEAQPEARS